MGKFPHEGSTPPSPPQLVINHPFILRRPFVNNQIRANEVRVIDETGKQLGILALQDALSLTQERGFDLIQVTEKVLPPVCKIMDYGKYLYSLEKKEKANRVKTAGELKGIRLRFNISPNDMETKAKQADKFLKKGYKIRVELILRGREKALQNFARQKISQFLEILQKQTAFKIERELKREPRGFTVILAK